MAGTGPLITLMEHALPELDRSLGRRKSGRAISGHLVPSYKDVVTGEDPLYLTLRVLVVPVIASLGYGDVTAADVAEGFVPGIAMATVSMNNPVTAASGRVICAMRADGAPRGIATNGFRWVLVDRGRRGPRVSMVSDLRPYYVEVLDRDRFRTAEPVDRGALVLFDDGFNNRPE